MKYEKNISKINKLYSQKLKEEELDIMKEIHAAQSYTHGLHGTIKSLGKYSELEELNKKAYNHLIGACLGEDAYTSFRDAKIKSWKFVLSIFESHKNDIIKLDEQLKNDQEALKEMYGDISAERKYNLSEIINHYPLVDEMFLDFEEYKYDLMSLYYQLNAISCNDEKLRISYVSAIEEFLDAK